MIAFLRRHWKILVPVGVVGLAVAYYLVFIFFAVHLLFVDDKVNESGPLFDSGAVMTPEAEPGDPEPSEPDVPKPGMPEPSEPDVPEPSEPDVPKPGIPEPSEPAEVVPEPSGPAEVVRLVEGVFHRPQSPHRRCRCRAQRRYRTAVPSLRGLRHRQRAGPQRLPVVGPSRCVCRRVR